MNCFFILLKMYNKEVFKSKMSVVLYYLSTPWHNRAFFDYRVQKTPSNKNPVAVVICKVYAQMQGGKWLWLWLLLLLLLEQVPFATDSSFVHVLLSFCCWRVKDN